MNTRLRLESVARVTLSKAAYDASQSKKGGEFFKKLITKLLKQG